MVTGASLALPFAVVIALWFVSTGVVAMISHRLRTSFGRSLLIACICAFVGLGLVALSSQSTSVWLCLVRRRPADLELARNQFPDRCRYRATPRALPTQSRTLATLQPRNHGAYPP
jgi:hypothetical protein